MKKYIFLFIISFMVSSANAQYVWHEQISNTSNDLKSVFFADPYTGYAVGNNGTIVKTINGGSTWIVQTSGTSINLSSVHFVNALTGYCVGGSSPNVILKTVNGGGTWAPLSSGTSNILTGVFFTDENTGYVTQSSGSILKTINGGTGWSPLMSENCHSVFFLTQDTGYVSCSGGKVFRTTNEGTTWNLFTAGTAHNLLSVNFLDYFNGVTVGNNGTIRRTTNTGVTWLAMGSGDSLTKTFYSTQYISSNRIVAVGKNTTNALIVYSTNGGVSTQETSLSTVSALHSVHFPGPFTGYTVGSAGKIFKFSDSSNVVSGVAYRDLNANNVKDPGEPPLSNAIVEVNPGPHYVNTNSLGRYDAYLPAGNFTITLPNPPLYYNVSPVSHSVSFVGLGGIELGKDFALVAPAPVNDVKITLTGFPPPRPGFNYNCRITYENVGTQTMSDNVKMNFPANINYLSSSPSGSVAGNVITWAYTGLEPGEIRDINIAFNIPIPTPLGTLIETSAMIEPLTGDPTVWNNLDTLKQIVIGSYDPNDKQVFPSGDITPQQVSDQDSLTYLIRFQNTGTAEAFTVVVTDTLSNNLDLESFEMISASHSYEYTLESNGHIKWTFDNINLPDSNTNEPGSHGFIKYSIKPKSTLALGDEIANTAYIYFDFNTAIITNTIVTIVAEPSGIILTSTGMPVSYALHQNYPNPFNPTTKINFDIPKQSVVKLVIYDMLGREVSTLVNGQLNPGQYSADWNGSGLASGMYFYKLEAGSFSQIKKMILIK